MSFKVVVDNNISIEGIPFITRFKTLGEVKKKLKG